MDAKWFYSWGPNKPDETPADVEFMPMIWGKYNARRPKVLEQLQSRADRGDFRYLMGFNEPDQHKQSDISVEEALSLWPNLMKTGLPLASPSCVHADREWMQRFMAEVEARKLRVDFICVHSYAGPNAQALIDRLKRIHEMYGRPIWITEFAVGDWTAKSAAENKHSPEKVARFMRKVLPMLERLDFVERYAWYSASPESKALGTSALFDENGELTDLGKLYQSF